MRAKRSLGQNFLQDREVIDRIIATVDPQADETVVEIGPGQGALTTRLLELAGDVVAIEFDRDMIAHLKAKFASVPNLRLLAGDALDVDFSAVLSDRPGAKLVANLPYNISTPILQRLAAQRELFSMLVLMFQREVVDRITARPSTGDRGFLSVIVQDAFEVERLFDVSPTAFRPVPKVWSSVVRLRPKGPSGLDNSTFRSLVSAGFAHRRKTLLNNLKATVPDAARVLTSNGINPSRRAETLTLDEWHTLCRAL